MRGRAVSACLSLFVFVLLPGCQKASGPVETPGDPGEVENLVYETTARQPEKEQFDALFADGATLSDKERQAFKGMFVKPDNVTINGDTATIEVLVGHDDANGDYVETAMTWEAKKQGGAWKLTKAPLK